MSYTTKRYLLSSATTFLTVAATTLAVQLQSGAIQWTSTFWASILLTVVRAGVKALVESWAGQNADA